VYEVGINKGKESRDCFLVGVRSTQPPVQWVLGLFPRGKAARAWHWSPWPPI